MTPDLITAFFQRDLTNEEDEALARTLSESIEESGRFADEAAKFYTSLTLPEPQWPGGPPPSGMGGVGAIAAGIVGGLIVGAAITWKVCTLPITVEFAPPVPAEEVTPAAPVPPEVAPVAEPSPQPSKPVVAPAKAAPASAKDPRAPVAEGPAARKPEGYDSGNELIIKVVLKEASSLIVDIQDASGRRIRRLAAGRFPAGIQRFPWDGKDAEGQAVPPGRYTVLVNRDGIVMEQTLEIRSKR